MIKQSIVSKLGKLPVVILPLADYERMQEDLEMLQSKRLPKEIARARGEIKMYSATEAKRLFLPND